MKKLLSVALSVALLCWWQAASANTGLRVLSLDGIWELQGFSPDRYNHVELNAKVPGQVHDDLLEAGIIEDPFWRDNAEKCQWVEYWQWRYSKRFFLPADFRKSNVQLEFDGLDTFASVKINGRNLGPAHSNTPATTDNMFRKWTFDVTDQIRPGEMNVVEVTFFPIREIIGREAENHRLPVTFNHPYRPYVRRVQCTFGWDWVNRFVTAGIWKPCRIVSYNDSRITDASAYATSVSKAKADMHFSLKAKGASAEKVKVSLNAPSGKTIWSTCGSLEDGNFDVDAAIANPQLWWPAGSGRQPLYTVEYHLLDKKGGILDSRIFKTGIRTARVDMEQDGENASRFVVYINDVPIFCKGGNWIPADPFPARIKRDKYERLLGQCAESGSNMLRVWGGGIYEHDMFYEIADSLGIMIMQDFMLSCSAYPETPQFTKTLLAEIEENVQRLRHHPCIAFWTGGNEIALGRQITDAWPLKDLYLQTISPMMKELDPSRSYSVVSPYGIDKTNSNSYTSGDAHHSAQFSRRMIYDKDAVQNWRQIVLEEDAGRFLSENTTAGAPTKESLLKFMTEEDLEQSEMYDYHSKDNPYIEGPTLFGKLEDLSQRMYGLHGGDVDRRLEQMACVQRDFIRAGLECMRSRKFYSSGLLFWMYNDCWPASGWSVIDYWGERKAGWYALRSGCAPVIVATIQDKDADNMQVWISSDSLKDSEGRLEVSIVPTDGSTRKVLIRKPVQIPANRAFKAWEGSLSKISGQCGRKAVLVAELKYGNRTDRSLWTPGAPKDVEYVKSGMKLSGDFSGTEGKITITTDKWANMVVLHGEADFDDNYFEMLPGETRTISWKSIGGKPLDSVKVSSWN